MLSCSAWPHISFAHSYLLSSSYSFQVSLFQNTPVQVKIYKFTSQISRTVYPPVSTFANLFVFDLMPLDWGVVLVVSSRPEFAPLVEF